MLFIVWYLLCAVFVVLIDLRCLKVIMSLFLFLVVAGNALFVVYCVFVWCLVLSVCFVCLMLLCRLVLLGCCMLSLVYVVLFVVCRLLVNAWWSLLISCCRLFLARC